MDVEFFVDNNFGAGLVRALRELGFSNVEHLTEKFPEDTEDEIWLKYVGENRMALITKDKKIRYNPKEKDALVRYKVVAFYLQGSEMGARATTLQLVNGWEKMEAKAAVQLKKGVACAFSVRRGGGGKLAVIPLT